MRQVITGWGAGRAAAPPPWPRRSAAHRPGGGGPGRHHPGRSPPRRECSCTQVPFHTSREGCESSAHPGAAGWAQARPSCCRHALPNVHGRAVCHREQAGGAPKQQHCSQGGPHVMCMSSSCCFSACRPRSTCAAYAACSSSEAKALPLWPPAAVGRETGRRMSRRWGMPSELQHFVLHSGPATAGWLVPLMLLASTACLCPRWKIFQRNRGKAWGRHPHLELTHLRAAVPHPTDRPSPTAPPLAAWRPRRWRRQA